VRCKRNRKRAELEQHQLEEAIIEATNVVRTSCRVSAISELR
jgi:hypothetical protein